MALGIAAFASASAADEDDPEYGPDHVSTGTGFTGCTPKGS